MKLWGLCLAMGLLVGCASGDGSDGADANGNALSGAGAGGATSGSTPDDHTITGLVAERLINAFERANAVDHAPGGRANVHVTALSVVISSNSSLEQDDADFNVPSTEAMFDQSTQSPPHRDVKDPRAVAAFMFDTLGAVDPSLGGSATGTSLVTASNVECEGQGPGPGDDPNDPPPTTAKCTVTSKDGNVFSVDTPGALAIVHAFGLASPESIDHGGAGRFALSATNVSCESRSNEFIEQDDPLFQVPVASCKADVPDAKPFSVDDADPVALALMKALEAAGLPDDHSAGGKIRVAASQVTCSRAPGQDTQCVISR
jgi:hypothetical protein